MEKLKQEINYHLQRRGTLWAFSMLFGGGAASLILRLNDGLMEKILFGIGLILCLFFINASLSCEEYIRKLISKIEKGK